MGRIKYDTWEELLTAADRVLEAEPWKYLDGADLIALHFKDRGSVYVNVLGNGGKLYGLHMIDGEEELMNLLTWLYREKLGYAEREALGMCDILSVEWDDAKFLGKDQKQALRKLNRTYPEKQWPGFMHYGRNVRFYEIDSRDTDLLLRSMKAVTELTESYFRSLPDMRFLDVITVFECAEQEDGSWKTEHKIVNEGALLAKKERAEQQEKELKDRPKAEGLAFGMFEVKEVTDEEPAGSAVMVIDLRSFLPVSLSACEPGDTTVQKYERALDSLAGKGLKTPDTVRLKKGTVDEDTLAFFSSLGISVKNAESFGDIETFLQYRP